MNLSPREASGQERGQGTAALGTGAGFGTAVTAPRLGLLCSHDGISSPSSHPVLSLSCSSSSCSVSRKRLRADFGKEMTPGCSPGAFRERRGAAVGAAGLGPVWARIHPWKCWVDVNTPGLLALAQPWPQLASPTSQK